MIYPLPAVMVSCGHSPEEYNIITMVNVSVDEQFVNDKNAFSFAKARPLVYSHGHYFGLGKKIGRFGWSVQKKKKKTRKPGKNSL